MKAYKLVIHIPATHADEVRLAIGEAGAGRIGNYDSCCFVAHGKGYFRPLAGANPSVGAVGELAEVDEVQLTAVCTGDVLEQVIAAMKESHPYEVPAYDVVELLDV